MFKQGIYEQLLSKLITAKLDALDKSQFYIKKVPVEKHEAGKILSQYLGEIINLALDTISHENKIDHQIELANKIILLLSKELRKNDFEGDLVESSGEILRAIFSKHNFNYTNFEDRINEITPFTRLTQSELFTGSNVGISLESELKKEILSSDKIYFLVSFIRWSGIRIFEKELREFTSKGNKLKVITTCYMGATELKAVEFLAGLPNTEIKVSYNTDNERLHAKSYLFFRNTNFHTGYIGSSNLSRSALTNGLEWNLKVTSKEISHIIDKFAKTFETYWQDTEFETFRLGEDTERLRRALNRESNITSATTSVYFDIQPYPYQKEILEKLEAERTIHKRFRNLIVAATGTGKTIISAFDFKSYIKNNPNAKLLYIAHRKEILKQARATFCGILRNNNFGDFWVDGQVPSDYNAVFASVMTLNNQIDELNVSEDFFDFIIIDEVHHITANSYRPILKKFKPRILLGLTATPERMDGENILEDFDNEISAEIRLPEALNRKLLCPFQYFGITDSVDLSRVTWKNGKYLPGELSSLYTSNDIRTGEIISKCESYLGNFKDVRALGFCVTREHAIYMAEKFNLGGLKADYLVSNSGREEYRDSIKERLQKKEINYLFVVDIFNEGVDIPEIDTVLFLRPTESLTIFIQQLGRGLRLAEGKECLTVLDFVGNSRPEYDFQAKFRAMIGKTNSSTKEEIEKDFPHLPSGCAIVLEKKAKEIILDNIKKATISSVRSLRNKISNFEQHTVLPLNIKNFIGFYHLSLQDIYKHNTWSELLFLEGKIPEYSDTNKEEFRKSVLRKWIPCNSFSYFSFILKLAKNNFNYIPGLNRAEELMLVMLYHDFWQSEDKFNDLWEGISKIGTNRSLVEELIEVLELLIDKISHIERDIVLPFEQPLKLHSRYSRDQILSAFEQNTFDKKKSNREGVVNIKEKRSELLLITLEKTEKDFSPATMYNDYAISSTQFHWQSQNSARPDKGAGLSYINHKKENKNILLFVRERNSDEYGNTMSYVFLGKASYMDHYGSKPMSIKWQLEEPIPPYLWKESAKMAIG